MGSKDRAGHIHWKNSFGFEKGSRDARREGEVAGEEQGEQEGGAWGGGGGPATSLTTILQPSIPQWG